MSAPRGPIDIEKLLEDALDDRAGHRVYTELPHAYELPVGRLTLLPGGGQADGDHQDHRLNRDRVQLEAFGTTAQTIDGKANARDLIDELVEAALNLEAKTYPQGTLTAIDLESSPYWLPDPLDDAPRYIAVISVYSHP